MKIEKGQIVQGEITRVVREAVFVDIGTLREAVVPKMDVDKLDGDRSVTLEVGEIVAVYIYYVPQNGGNPLGSITRALGIPNKSTQQQRRNSDPWATLKDDYKEGEIVEGTVKNIKKYGAFVELPNGMDGLVHVSEMEPGFTSSPWDVVTPGDKVRVRVICIEPHRKRVRLSLNDV
jgi:small subunit ribosomal protein S1